MPLKLEMKLDE